MKFANFPVAQFLAQYWQRKPLLIKGALPGFTDPLSPEELAGLACEPEVEARLVSTRGKHYSMRSAPFTEADFTSLPAKRWTLLVQAVDQYVPEVKSLLQTVDFIPSWRVDDVMISYATAGGGVGPHFDYYDVFLVQGQGTRTWRLGQHCTGEDALQSSSGLKLLADFKVQAEYQLEPGDVLYVPPCLAHWGIADTDSLCYSLGFRAPSASELLSGYCDEVAQHLSPDLRYTDPLLEAGATPGEISPSALARAQALILGNLQDSNKLLRWFGCMQTQQRYPELTGARSRISLTSASVLSPDTASRFAWSMQGKELLLFVNGRCLTLPDQATMRKLLPLLCSHGTPFRAGAFVRVKATRELLEQLLGEGALHKHKLRKPA